MGGGMAQQNGKSMWEAGGMAGRREERSSLRRRTEAGIWGRFQGLGSGLVRQVGWGPSAPGPPAPPGQAFMRDLK